MAWNPTQLNAQKKGMALTALIVVAFALILCHGLWIMNAIKPDGQEAMSIQAGRDWILRMEELRTDLMEDRASMMNLLLAQESPGTRPDQERMRQVSARIHNGLADLMETAPNEELGRALANVRANWERMRGTLDNEVIPSLIGNREKARSLILGLQRDRHISMLADLTNIKAMALETVSERHKASGKAVAQKWWGHLALGVAGSGACLALALWMLWGAARPLSRLTSVIERLAEGDIPEQLPETGTDEAVRSFTAVNKVAERLRSMEDAASRITRGDFSLGFAPASSKDQTGKALSGMSARLQEFFADLNRSAQSVVAAGQNLAHAAMGTTQAVSGLNGIISQITQSTSSIAQSAQMAASSSKSATEMSRKGQKVSENLKERIQSMRQSVMKGEKSIESLGQRSARIGEIVNVITKIAEQTNLLSLNAAIEAARAGESGRGFAVVADEIRKLAEHSAQSAQQISKLISEVQGETSNAVHMARQVAQDVEEGASMMNETDQALRDILSGVENVARQVEQIAAATEELAASTEEAAASSAEQSSSIDELGASAQNLGILGAELKEIVVRLKV